MNIMTLYAFLALAAAICTVGFHAELSARFNTAKNAVGSTSDHKGIRLPLPSLLFAAIALLLALSASVITVPAALLLSLLTGLAVWLAVASAPAVIRSGGWLLLAVTALASALHLLPGIQNPLLINAAQLTPDAIPYTLYANFDKGWAGYCLLLAIWPTQRLVHTGAVKSHAVIPGSANLRRDFWRNYWRGFWPVWPLTVMLALGLALSLGLIKPAPKWPDFALQFIFCNLLLTCVAEEAFFRGLLQRPLGGILRKRGLSATTAAWFAIVAVSLLFGLAHLAGGWAYALVATIASIGYGWAYQRSGRIEVAIVAHFALNLVHFSLFTYPMLG
jgi:membrane protease YdiL (CAAX protease family)